MDQRIGTCDSCEARYKIPASFTGTKAKCKKCGGVVIVSGAAPAASKAPKPIPAKKPAPKPAPKPVAKAPAKPAAKPVRAQPAAKPVKPVAKAAAAGGAAGAAKVTRGRPSKVRAGSARRGSKRAVEDDDGDEPKTARGGRRGRPAKKKSNAPLITTALLAVVIGVGGFLWWQNSNTEAAAAENDTAELAQAPTEDAEGTLEGAAEAVDDAAAELADETTGSEDDPETTDDAADEDTAAEDDEQAFPDPAAEKQPDPDSVDLSEWPDLERFAGTTDEEWEEMNEWMALAVDPSAGAPAGRARTKLFDADRKAFPVILNHFKTLDFSDEQDLLMGDATQKLLEEICRGNNFDWRYTTEPKDVLFNKKVVIAWMKAWNQAKDSDLAWANLAKRDKPEKKEVEDDLGDLDDF